MPRIPKFEPHETYDVRPISPEAVTVGMEQIGRVAGEIGSQVLAWREKERKAEEKKNALRADNEIRKFVLTFSQELYRRGDYHNFEPDLIDQIKQLRERLQPITRDRHGNISPELEHAVEKSVSQAEFQLREVLGAKAWQLETDETKANLMEAYNYAVEEMAYEARPIEIKIKKRQLQDQMDSVVDAGYISKTDAVVWTKDFEKDVAAKAAELEYVSAREAIRRAPKQAAIDLRDDKYLPRLEPRTRQTLIDMADTAVKQLETEEENRQREAHDKEENLLSVKLWTGKLTPIDVLGSTTLTGDEKHTWMTRLKAQIEEPAKATNSQAYMAIWSQIHDNPRQVNKTAIRESILYAQSQKLLTDSDAQELNRKAQTEQDSRISSLKTEAANYMQSQFIPKTGHLQPIASTPKQWKRFHLSVQILDEQVDRLFAEGKPVTKADVRVMADELVKTYAPSMAQLIQELTESMKEMGEEVKERRKAKEKGEPPPPSKPMPTIPKRLSGETIDGWRARTGRIGAKE